MQKQSFDHDWRFHLGDAPEGNILKLDDSTWRLLDLPHDWSIEGERHPANPSGYSGGYFPMGCGWYRKTFAAPEAWQGSQVLVEFEGVYMNAEVWLNEHFLGRHPYGYTSFVYDLSPYLNYGAQNLLRVMVDNACQLNSRWYSGSGIYRHVWLMVANPIHVGHWGIAITTPQVTQNAAVVQVHSIIENNQSTVQDVILWSHLLAPGGVSAGVVETRIPINAHSKHDFANEIRVSNPHLWSPESPALYQLETEVWIDDKVVDRAATTLGIRSLKVDAAQGFLLNGIPVKLKGGCVHHDNGVMGAASFDRSEERKVELLKASGFNAIRCAHNPPAPAFLDACDRLGMLVIDEAFDCWQDGKNLYDYHVSFDDWWRRDTDSMILRDRNHPCVVLWSIGNELIERFRPEGFAIGRMLANHVRTVDPTRPVTAAMCGAWGIDHAWPESEGFFAALDVGGYNYEWKNYHTDHQAHPQRVMAGTESFPLEAFENWTLVQENNYVIGDFVWTSLDYLGESGIGRVHYGGDNEKFLGQYPWHHAFCGDLDLCGFKRPQSYYRDMVWQNGARLYIAVHYPIPEGKTEHITQWGWPDVAPNWTWPGYEAVSFKVDVYSACERVELFLNDRSLGVKPSGRQEKFIATFAVPYEPGELKAVGSTEGKPCAEYLLQTSGAPVKIQLTPDRAAIQANARDLCFVTVEVLDAAGHMHPNADQSISFTVEGEGTLAAVGNGNPTSTESYRGSLRNVYRGRCLVVVKSNGNPGEIRLKAQAEGLEPANVIIRTA